MSDVESLPSPSSGQVPAWQPQNEEEASWEPGKRNQGGKHPIHACKSMHNETREKVNMRPPELISTGCVPGALSSELAS